MSNLKLGVDVVSAHNLLPKDGQGSASSFVELYFDGQKFRTTIKEKDRSSVCNQNKPLEADIEPQSTKYVTSALP